MDTLRPADALALLQSAERLQAAERAQALPQVLKGCHLALLSDDHGGASSTDFYRAATALGAQVARVPAHEPAGGDARTMAERARMLGRLYQGIECQGMSDEQVADMALAAGVPVFNHWGSAAHPLSVLADLMTIHECTGKPLGEITLGFGGDPHSPAAQAVQRATELAGVELQPVSEAGAVMEAAASGGAGSAVLDHPPDFLCLPGAGGGLPLVLRPLRRTDGGTSHEGLLEAARAANRRHLLQAMLLAAIG